MPDKEIHIGDGDRIKIERPFHWGLVLIISIAFVVVGGISALALSLMAGKATPPAPPATSSVVAPPVATVAPTPTPQDSTKVQTVSVPANVEWFSSGILVNAGQLFSIIASGSWTGNKNDYKREVVNGNANGVTNLPLDSSVMMPNAPIHSLIGKIGNGTPFLIGSRFFGTAYATGVLYLSINDTPGSFGDNDDV